MFNDKTWSTFIYKRYLRHLIDNWSIAIISSILAAFHFVHGVAPLEYTSHEYWKINFSKLKDKL